MAKRPWSIGSVWQRWDPHIHAPGTLLNDQFGGDWPGFFAAIQNARPEPVALGITDYFTLRAYKAFLANRPAGGCSSVELVFPNVELRLSLQTKDGGGVNLHLLVSPNEKDHVARMEEALANLSFSSRGNPYPCTDEGLKRLGRAHRNDPTLADDAALSVGANQFKVDLTELRNLIQKSDWLRENVIVGVAAGKDGLSGLAPDASFKAQREELGRFAQFVFSGLASDRTYWLGGNSAFKAEGQSPKPCLHGCDAHQVPRVLAPERDRRLWIRGEPTFEALRQTLVEPERRVFIGPVPPPGAQSDEAIGSLYVEPAPWLKSPDLLFNPGLVTIIGAKGSGKTALADLLALATGADEDDPGPASFLAKARPLLGNLRAEARWNDGTVQVGSVASRAVEPFPRVLYLSQQFVERLSAPAALTEPLVEEIERVVFGAIPNEDRLETGTFGELRDLVLEGPRSSREFEQSAIVGLTRIVGVEQASHRSLPGLRKALTEATRARDGLEKEIAAIRLKATAETIKAHQASVAAVQTLTDAIAKAERQAVAINEVAAEASRIASTAATQLTALKERYPSLLSDEVWDLLRPEPSATGQTRLIELAASARDQAVWLRQTGKVRPKGATGVPAETPEGLTASVAARDKLTAELGLDQAIAKRRLEMEKRLTLLKTNEGKAGTAVKKAEGAAARVKEAQRERLAGYEQVFSTLVAEQKALMDIYSPLSARVARDSRLSKLTVVVNRVADLEAWSTRGEELFDLRKPPFSGRGDLAKEASLLLAKAWTTGTSEEVRAAMQAFTDKHAAQALEAMAQGVTPLDVGAWLFSTDHISVRYGIEYEGVQIARLSPGTRGVVLLTLYLALDEWDIRPLLIDQPEENLDPSSIYDDLVPFFREAANRRQIIMVTHNANLVVNTDSDQVIVASAVRPDPSSLPNVSYDAGGLEDASIRAAICRLLEGGEQAFRKRGIRYGLP